MASYQSYSSSSYSSSSSAPSGGLFGMNIGTPFDSAALFSMSSLPRSIQTHLSRVYVTVGACIASAAFGAFANVRLGLFASMPGLPSLFSLLLVIALSSTRNTKDMRLTRLGMLLTFGFLNGLSIGPLIALAEIIDPSTIVTALLSTTAIFMCFTASALFAERRSMLYLGGILSSALSLMLFASFINIFFPSSAVPLLHLYGGLFVFCGFVLFDTQMILEQSIQGDRDYILQALNLFIDFVAIFVRILIILLQNSQEKKEKKRNRR